MKTKSILSIILLFSSMTAIAQHPLVGTWEMVTIKGTDSDGKAFDWNNANIRETKIITPTHYMLIQHTVRNDSVIFNTAHAGTVKIEGNKYIETPTVTSSATLDIAKTDFTWKVKGEQFIQSGTITLPDGKKIILDELVFKKISSSSTTKNPIVGTWNQLSSEYTSFDGTKDSHTSPVVTRFDIFTPSNWARIGHRDGKFESAMISSYILQNGKIAPTVIVASSPIYAAHKYEISYRVDGSKLYVNGRATNAEGKELTWNDVFQKASGK